MGGIFGAVDGLGGAVEHQRAGSPHFHGFATLASPFQHCSLHEIARLIQDRSLDIEALKAYRVHVCQEEHFDQLQHDAGLDRLEAGWRTNYSGYDHIGLSFVSADVLKAAEPPLWTSEFGPVTGTSGGSDGSRFSGHVGADADDYTRLYRAEAQFVFSRVQHHWHPMKKNGNREPTNYCKLKGCKGKVKSGACKAGFPKDAQVGFHTMVVCRGVAQRLKLSVRGRRNALGSLVAKRSCPWFSGTAAAFSIAFRCNTNTTPNFRVPLSFDTHEPSCRLADCSQGLTTKRLSLLAQRACTQMTGYFAGYISKRQPVGRYELRASCGNLARMMDTLPHRTHFSQYLRVVNRMFTDLETKGTLRTAPEVYNLAANLNVKDPM